MTWLGRRWRKFYDTFISLKGPPEKIALSFSIGFWIAWFPIIGTHSVLSILGSALFRTNMPAIYLGSWICNPLTWVPMLVADYAVGRRLVGGAHLREVDFGSLTLRSMLSLGWEIIVPLLVGGLLLGLANALLAYYPVKWAVVRSRASSTDGEATS
jgi:uncharacterized protein